MLNIFALVGLLSFGSASGDFVCVPSDGPGSDDDLKQMYETGQPYGEFLAGATRRAELWHGNTERAEDIDPTLLARAQAVGGTWYVLAVAIDACSDSVSTIPYLARLVSLVDGLDMRIVDSTVGRAVMEAHPTPDGRAATPTVLLLDADFDEAGCFIERPPSLQEWMMEHADERSREDATAWKMDWYEADSGQETLETFVEMMEAAASGGHVCG